MRRFIFRVGRSFEPEELWYHAAHHFKAKNPSIQNMFILQYLYYNRRYERLKSA